MSLNSEFTNVQNARMLWEVIVDAGILQNKSQSKAEEIQETFKTVFSQFAEKEKKYAHPNLISMNKKFVSVIFNILNPPQNQIKEPITYEEIKQLRVSQFEQEFNSRQQEFSHSMTIPVPSTPKFTDSGKDEPIGEMEVMVKRVIAQRNMEMNQYQSQPQTQEQNKTVENWLKPAETSVKAEKVGYKSQNQQPIKYIKIDTDNLENHVIKKDIIDLQQLEQQQQQQQDQEKKSVSWNQNITMEISESIEKTHDIFSKLKSLEPPPINRNQLIDEQVSDKTEYKKLEEQIKNLSNTLESHMDRCNNTLTLLYKMVLENQQHKEHESKTIEQNQEQNQDDNANLGDEILDEILDEIYDEEYEEYN